MMNLSLLLLLASSSLAQFVAQDASRLTVVRSPANSNVTVSYRQPDGACRTAFSSQKQYTGWVNVPGEYPTNLFFWFVEARQRTDSLTIWLNGGPGSSSMYGFFGGNGPCEIVEKGLDQYDTVAREWGWDRSSNMLFIDQPNQVGFAYDTPSNGTLSLLDGTMEQPPVHPADFPPPWAQLNGTFSSLNSNNTANTTEIAAMAVWHMIQGFLSAFPQYQPPSNGSASLGINLFAESYGGRYGPIFAETWEEQNQKRLTGVLARNTTLALRVKSLGIVNGCIDRQIETPLYPIFAHANTYGFKALSEEEAAFYEAKYAAPGGCRDLLNQCISIAAATDPEAEGDVQSVNDICSNASLACNEIQAAYYNSGRSVYDLAAPTADPYPAQHFLEYLNSAAVQRAIGSPVNFTMTNYNVFSEFGQTGDIARGGNIARLADLLMKGVRVGLIYGDRDYICNWYGGEAVSLGVAALAGNDYSTKFPTAGYAPIIVNDSYIGGVVRQYGNLSFSRVYQAGHAVAWYQPETAFQIFARIIMGKSVSTGASVDLSLYNTTGPANATQTAKLPKQPKQTCYVRAFQGTCDKDDLKLVTEGRGVVINGILYSSSEDWPLMAKTATPSTTTSLTSSTTETFTGVYTATDTPDNDNAGASRQQHLAIWSTFLVFTHIWIGIL